MRRHRDTKLSQVSLAKIILTIDHGDFVCACAGRLSQRRIEGHDIDF